MFYIDYIGVPVIIGAILTMVFAGIKWYSIHLSNNPKTIAIFAIWLLGLLTFLTGILHQIINLRNSFYIIEQMREINATIISASIYDSFTSTISGLVVFIVSLFLWGIVKTKRDGKAINMYDDVL